MNYWTANVYVYAHSTGNGREKDRESVGGERQTFTVKADEFDEAVELVRHILVGIEANPMVWKAGILGIERKDIR